MTIRLSAPFRAWWASVRPGPGELRREAVADLPGAIGGVPDGMASAVLAGEPVFGLYASFAGPVAGVHVQYPVDGDIDHDRPGPCRGIVPGAVVA